MRIPANLSRTLLTLVIAASPIASAWALDQNENINDDIRFAKDLARYRFFDLAVEWLSLVEKKGGLSEDNRIEVSLAKADVAELASGYALTRAERTKGFDASIKHYEAAIAGMKGGMSRRMAEAIAEGLARVLISKGNFYIDDLARLRAQEADAAAIKEAKDNAEAAFRDAVKALNSVYGDITDYIENNDLSDADEATMMQLAMYALYRKGEAYFNWAMLYEPQEFNREDYLTKCSEALTDYIWEAGDEGIFPLLAYYYQGMAEWEIGKIHPDRATEQDGKALDRLFPIFGEFGISNLPEVATLEEGERDFVLSVLARGIGGVARVYREAANRIEQSSTIADDADLADAAFAYKLLKRSNPKPERSWLLEGAVGKATLVNALRDGAAGMVTELEDDFKKNKLPLGDETYRAQLEKSRALVDAGRAGQALSIVKDIAQANSERTVGMEANALLSELLEVTDESAQPPDVWMMAGDGAYGEERWLDAVDAYNNAIAACATEDDRKLHEPAAWRHIAECYQRLGRNLEAALAFDTGYQRARGLGDDNARDELAMDAYNAWNRRFSETATSYDEKQRNRVRDEVQRLGISADLSYLVAREKFVDASAVKEPGARKAAFLTAVKEFEGVPESSAYYDRGLVYKARSYAEAGQTDDAIKTFDSLFERAKDPSKKVNLDKKKSQQRDIALAEGTFYEAQVLLDQNQYDRVLKLLEGYESTFDRQNAFFPSVNYYRVKSLVGLGRIEEAENLVGAMQAEHKSSSMTAAALNQVAAGHHAAYQAIENKESDEALAHLRSAAEYLGEYNRLTGYGSFANLENVADWYKAIDEVSLAEENYQRLLDKFGKSPKYQKDINQRVKRNMAEVLLAQNKFPDALPLWREVYAGNSRNADITRSFARCLGGWLEESTNDVGINEYKEIPGAGQYQEAMDLWIKLKDGIEATDGKQSDAWWETMTNYLYCEYMLGKQNPQVKIKAKGHINQWKALFPDLGGDPHRRRLRKIEQALN